MSGKVGLAVCVVRDAQGLPKIYRAPMYRAYRAVIFAIAQLSCIGLIYTVTVLRETPSNSGSSIGQRTQRLLCCSDNLRATVVSVSQLMQLNSVAVVSGQRLG